MMSNDEYRSDGLRELLERAASAAAAKNMIAVVLMPAAQGISKTASSNGDTRISADFTIREYKREYGLNLSVSRIREQCAGGHFPDTSSPTGTVPGAYKDSAGEWRITREGIRERQRIERERGLGLRQSAAENSVAPAMAVQRDPIDTAANTLANRAIRVATQANGNLPSSCADQQRISDAPLRVAQGAWKLERGID